MKNATQSKVMGVVSFVIVLMVSACTEPNVSITPTGSIANNSFNGAQVSSKMNISRTETVSVSNLSELYNAVNDPENVRSIIVLAPGTYVLNSSYPNTGRIELQEDMKLQGQPGHPDQVVIDASALPESSFVPPLNFPGPRTGAVRMGRGTNELVWMTFIGNSTGSALSVIDTDLVWKGLPFVRISHCIVKGGRVGINIRNVGTAGKDRVLEAEILNNEVVDNLVQFGQGILVGNVRGASGASLKAYLTGNYVHGNMVGLRAFNNTDTYSDNVVIISRGDRYEENGIGLHLVGGVSQTLTTSANNNSIYFEGYGISASNNQGEKLPEDFIDHTPGGIILTGGQSFLGGETSNNIVRMKLWGCKVVGNNGPAVKVYGAISRINSPAGTNNLAELWLFGESKNSIVETTPSVPSEPAGTNLVNVFN